MKRLKLVALLGALCATPLSTLASQPMTLAEAVKFMESQFPGEVRGAELDTSGDKPAHYHIDMQLHHGATVRLEVDALTRRISARAHAADLRPGAMTLADAMTFVARLFPGELTALALDASDWAHPHYHADVRLSTGKVATLRIDALTRQVAWRNAAALED